MSNTGKGKHKWGEEENNINLFLHILGKTCLYACRECMSVDIFIQLVHGDAAAQQLVQTSPCGCANDKQENNDVMAWTNKVCTQGLV